jgi:hypothetical protein
VEASPESEGARYVDSPKLTEMGAVQGRTISSD